MKLNLNKLSIICILLFLASFFSKNIVIASENVASFPKELLYPEYFRINDLLLWENIRKELVFKLRFLTGRRPVKDYTPCHKFQRRISRAIDRAASEGKLEFSEVDNKLLFDKNTGFEKIISPQPSLLDVKCNYHSIGDINNGCILYCDYHGIDFECEFYKKYRKELEITKPLIIPEDVAELILFSPSLLVLLVIYFLLPKKKTPIPSITSEEKTIES